MEWIPWWASWLAVPQSSLHLYPCTSCRQNTTVVDGFVGVLMSSSFHRKSCLTTRGGHFSLTFLMVGILARETPIHSPTDSPPTPRLQLVKVMSLLDIHSYSQASPDPLQKLHLTIILTSLFTPSPSQFILSIHLWSPFCFSFWLRFTHPSWALLISQFLWDCGL